MRNAVTDYCIVDDFSLARAPCPVFIIGIDMGLGVGQARDVRAMNENFAECRLAVILKFGIMLLEEALSKNMIHRNDEIRQEMVECFAA